MALQTGIRLHQEPRSRVNTKPCVRAARLSKRLRRYAYFLDILGDYYLSQNWDEYYSHSRSTLSQQCYQPGRQRTVFSAEQSAQMARFLGYMRDTTY